MLMCSLYCRKTASEEGKANAKSRHRKLLLKSNAEYYYYYYYCHYTKNIHMHCQLQNKKRVQKHSPQGNKTKKFYTFSCWIFPVTCNFKLNTGCAFNLSMNLSSINENKYAKSMYVCFPHSINIKIQ